MRLTHKLMVSSNSMRQLQTQLRQAVTENSDSTKALEKLVSERDLELSQLRKTNDRELQKIASQVFLVEGQLRQEQKDIEMEMQRKDKIIHGQRKIIKRLLSNNSGPPAKIKHSGRDYEKRNSDKNVGDENDSSRKPELRGKDFCDKIKISSVCREKTVKFEDCDKNEDLINNNNIINKNNQNNKRSGLAKVKAIRDRTNLKLNELPSINEEDPDCKSITKQFYLAKKSRDILKNHFLKNNNKVSSKPSKVITAIKQSNPMKKYWNEPFL